MIFKRFTLFSLLVIFVGVTAFSLFEEKKERYFPRESQIYPDASFLAYMDFTQKVRANQLSGEVDPMDELRVKAQMDKNQRLSKSNLNLNWAFKGPDNVGGRARAIIVDRNDRNHILAGGVAGGLFESFDRGSSWTPYDPNFEITAISCITQDAAGDFYIGTGGHFDFTSGRLIAQNPKGRSTFFVGDGIFRLSGGGTFEKVIGIDTSNSNPGFGLDYASVGNIVADPTTPGKLYVAASQGFRVLERSGNSWTESSPIPYNAKCLDVNLQGNQMLVTFKNDINISDSARVYTSSDFFATQNYNLSKFNCGRIEGAIAPSSPNVMYLSAVTTGGCLFNIYRSSDAGQSWQVIGPGGSPSFEPFSNSISCQGYYDNLMAVSPSNPGKIFVGGITLWTWDQSSTDPAPPNGSWRQIDITIDRINGIVDPRYVHADKHNMVFDPTNSDIAYIVTDGGVTISENINSTQPSFLESNYNFGVTQYYYMDVNRNDLVMGGTQDNGTHLVGLRFNQRPTALEVQGGDGFGSVMSSINPEIGVASLYFNRFYRIQGIGTTLGNTNISSADVNNNFMAGFCSPISCQGPFNTVITLWESYDHEASRDSVEILYERVSLPPIPADTVIAFESNNNDVRQIVRLQNPVFPFDTTIGDNDTVLVNFILGTPNRVIANFDTIYFDLRNRQIAVVRRGQADTLINYQANRSYSISNVLSPTFNTKIDILDTNQYRVVTPQLTFRYRFKVHDKVQSILASANWAGVDNNVDPTKRNVYITRDLLKNTSSNRWYSIAGDRSTPDPINNGNDVLCMAFSKDGNHLFLGTEEGDVYRVSGIDSVWNGLPQSASSTSEDDIELGVMAGKCKKIGRFAGRAVTDIAVDPNNANNVIVALGNYGNSAYVARTTFALTATDPSSSFETIMGSGSTRLPNMPAYAALIDKRDSNRVYLGTDNGLFATDNAWEPNVNNVRWYEETQGIGRVPVYDIDQMAQGVIKVPTPVDTFFNARNPNKIDSIRWEYVDARYDNENKIYVATHARGIFEEANFVSVQNLPRNNDKVSQNFEGGLKVYPNPVRDFAKVEYKLADINGVRIQVYNLNGRLMMDEQYNNQSEGKNTLQLDLSELSNGTYIIRAISGDQSATQKLILYK